MKKRLAAIVAAALLGAMLWPAQTVRAQPTAASASGGRVAIVNMLVITKDYKKFKIFAQEMETISEPFQKQAKLLAERAKLWEDQLRKPECSEKDREEGQKALLQLKHLSEDNNAAAAKAIGSRRNEKLVQLYREIQDATQRYAVQNGIALVLQYTEPVTEADVYAPANINRKLQSSGAGAIVPMHVGDGVDITQDVLRRLNAPYDAAAAATPSGHP